MTLELLTKIKEVILGLLFPVKCVVCEKETEEAIKNKLICSACLKNFTPSTSFYCPLCEAKSIAGGVCFSCQPIAKGKFELDRLFTPLSYKEPAMRKVIKALKYDFIEGLAEPIGKLMTKYLDKVKKEIDFSDSFIIPVPLHKRKFNRRGYNQSELVAAEIAEFLDIKLLKDSLIKIRATKDQASLEEKNRIENLKGAFVCLKPEAVSGKKILLFDDVYTTGATMNECTRVLKESGAAEVSGLTIAR